MTRPIILHSGSWADVPLDELAGLSAEWGYQGFELCSWGKHFDVWQSQADDSKLQESLEQYPYRSSLARPLSKIATAAIESMSAFESRADFPLSRNLRAASTVLNLSSTK